MTAVTWTDEVLHFKNHLSIELSYANAVSYYKCKLYDPKLMTQGYVWHQIVVQHNGNCPGVEGKNNILNAIYRLIEGVEFYPVAYRRRRAEDRFLVRQCQAALDKLFDMNLRLVLPKGVIIFLQVQLNVAQYKNGQISPISQISSALNKLYNCMEEPNAEKGILNLSRFSQNSELFDIHVNMSCRGVLERVFELIYRNDERFRTIKGMILSDNGISTMSPFKLFLGVEFTVLDLRNNNLESYIRLNMDLQHVKADELKLIGNPITKSSSYPECLNPILGNFRTLDGIPTGNLSEDYRPAVSGKTSYRIDWSNKRDITQFETCPNWHSVMIPDAEQSYTKEEIIDYFFLGVSSQLSEVYPCYYKFANGEHQFLVRNCFDQIKHLVENCNLELQIPRFVAPPPPTENTTDYSPQLVMDTTIAYYIRMNASPFLKGQLEPRECIERALNRRFSGLERLMDLNHFQSAKGLENIVINLSSEKILKRVLTQVSQQFLTTCVELRLAHNKIVSANYPKILQLLTNLKAIDLGNNWIHNIDDIIQLSALSIQSLRLDGNPLCSKYSVAEVYIRDVKKHFTDLTKLDGIEVGANYCLSSPKNFLCDVSGYDFVNEFIPFYFTAFENNRREIKELYSNRAIVTVSFKFNVAEKTPRNSERIAKYMKHSLQSDYKPPYTSTYVGYKEIGRLLKKFPNVTYDMFTFRTDCTIFTKNMVVLTVNGLYLDLAPSIAESDILMGFSRTFVLRPISHRAGSLRCATIYKIINEHLSVFNPTPTQFKVAFKFLKSTIAKPDVLTADDKEALLVMLQEATSLKSIWCLRCMEDGDWDFEKALKVFVKLMEKKDIPDAAFY